MPYIIVLLAGIGIVVLQMTGVIPMDPVGGGLVIAAGYVCRRTGNRRPRGVDEETGCARLDREHRRLVSRRLLCRPVRRPVCGHPNARGRGQQFASGRGR
jgi:hypothetical protein